jgi:hypothetical protein
VRISDLSVSGCYLDSFSPLPNGTDIVVKICRDNGIFETNGKVCSFIPVWAWGSVSRIPSPHSKPFSSNGSQKSPAPKTDAFRAVAL